MPVSTPPAPPSSTRRTVLSAARRARALGAARIPPRWRLAVLGLALLALALRPAALSAQNPATPGAVDNTPMGMSTVGADSAAALAAALRQRDAVSRAPAAPAGVTSATTLESGVHIDYQAACQRLRPIRWAVALVMLLLIVWSARPLLRWGKATGWGGWPDGMAPTVRFPWFATLNLVCLLWGFPDLVWRPHRLPTPAGLILERCSYWGPQRTDYPDDIALPLSGER